MFPSFVDCRPVNRRKNFRFLSKTLPFSSHIFSVGVFRPRSRCLFSTNSLTSGLELDNKLFEFARSLVEMNSILPFHILFSFYPRVALSSSPRNLSKALGMRAGIVSWIGRLNRLCAGHPSPCFTPLFLSLVPLPSSAGDRLHGRPWIDFLISMQGRFSANCTNCTSAINRHLIVGKCVLVVITSVSLRAAARAT